MEIGKFLHVALVLFLVAAALHVSAREVPNGPDPKDSQVITPKETPVKLNENNVPTAAPTKGTAGAKDDKHFVAFKGVGGYGGIGAVVGVVPLDKILGGLGGGGLGGGGDGSGIGGDCGGPGGLGGAGIP